MRITSSYNNEQFGVSTFVCSDMHVALCLYRVLGLMYRQFYGQTSQESLYLSLVRPHLKYACQVWDPHLAKDKGALEKVQKFACKLATSKWDSSYEELLRLVEVKPLQDRRVELGWLKCIFLDTTNRSHKVHGRDTKTFT